MLKSMLYDNFYYKDGRLFNKVHRNSRAPIGAEAGTTMYVRGFGYRTIGINKKRYLTHRLIWLFFSEEDIPRGYEIDHINGDTLDNRIENLRCVEPHINRRNMRKVSTNTSGVTGVSWAKDRSKWYATAHDAGGKQKSIGYFEDKTEAEKAVKKFRAAHDYTERHGG